MPNWAEQLTAIATAVSAIGLLSAIGAVIFAGQQAREARIGRQAEMAVEFFRRWSQGPMVGDEQRALPPLRSPVRSTGLRGYRADAGRRRAKRSA